MLSVWSTLTLKALDDLYRMEQLGWIVLLQPGVEAAWDEQIIIRCSGSYHMPTARAEELVHVITK